MLVIGGSITRFMLWNHYNHKLSDAVNTEFKEGFFGF